MNTRELSGTDISSTERCRIDDLLRDAGIECAGVNGERYILLRALGDVPPAKRDTIAGEAMQTILDDIELQDLVGRTMGVRFLD